MSFLNNSPKFIYYSYYNGNANIPSFYRIATCPSNKSMNYEISGTYNGTISVYAI